MQYDIPLDLNRYLSETQSALVENRLEATLSAPDWNPAKMTDYGLSELTLQETSNPSFGEKEIPATDIFGDRNSQQDPIEGFVRDKLIIIEAAINQVLGEIEQREQLLTELLEDIDAQICIQKEMFFRIAPYGSSAITEGDPKRRVAIEGMLASLETEKRREQASAWKDIASLKRELRELLREYNEEKRKQRVIAQ